MKNYLLNILTYISLPIIVILYPIYYIIDYFFTAEYYNFRLDEDYNKLLFIDIDYYSLKKGRFIFVYLEKSIGDGFYKRFNKILKFKKLGFWNNQRKLKGKLIIFRDLDDREVKIGLFTSMLSNAIYITPGLHVKSNQYDHNYYYLLDNILILGYYEKY